MATDTFNNLVVAQGNGGYVTKDASGNYVVSISHGGTVTLDGIVSPTSKSFTVQNGSNLSEIATAIGDGSDFIVYDDPSQGGDLVATTAPVYGGEVFKPDLSFGNFGSVATPVAPAALPPTITQITPTSGSDLGSVTVTVSGANFDANDQVSIVGAGGQALAAAQVRYVDSGQLWATFNLTNAPPGTYQVQVNDAAGTALSPGTFQVTNNAAGQLSVSLALPQTTTEGTTAIGTVTYVNTGATDIAAPLLDVSSDQALLTGLGDTGGSNSIDFLGTNPNGPGGILQPGASGTYSFTYVPTQAAAQSGITISVGAAQPGAAIDLASDEAALKPPTVDATDWQNIYTQFEALVGGTTDSLDAALSQAATELSQVGQPTSDVATLLQYELFLASGALAGSDLLDATDLSATSSPMSLSLGRTYDGTLLNRDATGAFGDGWTSTYDVTATTASNGDVFVQLPGALHAFTLQADGTYSAQAGDGATLTVLNGLYQMEDGDGDMLQFDAAGRLASLTDASGNVTSLAYGSNGVLQMVENQTTHETIQFASNAAGRITKAIDSNGQTITYSYDPTNTLLLSATGPGGVTTYAYVPVTGSAQDNALTLVTNPDGTQQTFSYDAEGRLYTRSADNGTVPVIYSYANPGTVNVNDRLGHQTTALYGSNGAVAQVQDALGNVTQLGSDAAGALTSATTAGGSVYSFAYDASGNLISYTDPLGGTASASYAAGTQHLTDFSDQDGNKATYTYDAAGNVTGTANQDGFGNRYTYNTEGLLTSSTDADGNTTQYGYNGAGELTSKSFFDGTSDTYAYNADGDLTAATTSAGGTTSYAYDTADRLTSVINPQGQVESYTYNALGQLASRTEPDGSVTQYSYDSEGRLVNLQDGAGNLLDRYTYDAAGFLARTDTGNGAYTTFQYDPDGNVTQILDSNPDGSVAKEDTYTYDANGLVTQDSGTDGVWTYGYDASGELTAAMFQSTNAAIPNQAISYVYDAAGNRISQTVNGVVTAYTTNALNQYTTVGGTQYAYDKAGNLTSETNSAGTTTFAYDDSGQLASEDGPGGSYQYAYDALGNLVSTTQNGVTSTYINDPLSLSAGGHDLTSVAQVNAADASTTYNYGLGLSSMISSNGQATYVLSSPNGNVTGVTDAVGLLSASYDYLPFGQTLYSTAGSQGQFGFDGGLGVITLGNGLSSARARVYDPTTGRFLSADPTGLSGGLNLYSFSLNDPVNLSDPTGSAPIPTTGQLATANANAQAAARQLAAAGYPEAAGEIAGSANGQFQEATTTGPALSAAEQLPSLFSDLPGEIGGVAKAVGNGFAAFAKSGYKLAKTFKELGKKVGEVLPALAPPSNAVGETGVVPTATSMSGPSKPSGPTGSASGDTHITTFDGLHYDFQAAGEFTYAQNADITVQVRLEPNGGPQSPSGSVTYITQTAIGLGTDRLTFDFSRPQVFWLNGAPVTLIAGQSLSLAGGTVYATSQSGFVVQAATGEQVSLAKYTTTVSLDGHTSGVSGLLGNANGNPAQDLSLPNGTVLMSPLSYAQLYQTFSDAWRVTPATSLFDYAAGQTTATYTIPGFPPTPVTIADLPPALVQQATQYLTTLGITNPTQQQDAVLDYLLGNGSQTVLASDKADTAAATATASVQVTTPAVELLGVTGPVGPVPVGATSVAVPFQVFLTEASATPVVVQYAVLPATSAAQLGIGDFGGALPSGSVTIAAGATSASFSIAVPGTLRLPTESLIVGISTTASGVTLADATGGATLQSSEAVEGMDAAPAFQLLSGPGTLTRNGTAFTLNLGTIGTASVSDDIAVANLGSAGANVLGGSYGSMTGSGFTVVEPSVTSIVPGSDIGGPAITTDTDLGPHSETLVFDPTQSNASGYAGALAPITLTITDTVVASTANTFAISAVDADRPRGSSGATPFTFLVTRTGDTSAAQTLSYAVTGTGADPAVAADFGGLFPSGDVTFAADAATAPITVSVDGNTTVAPNETFVITISGLSGITTGSATGTIVNGANGGTSTPDVYDWIATSDGTWGAASNWADVTTGSTPAAVAPGIDNAVTIGGGNLTPEVVSGTGYSASLTLTGLTTLSGTFGTGALTVGTAANSGSLLIGAGSTVMATSATLADSPLRVSGTGAKLAVSGALSIGEAGTALIGQLFIASGGFVQVGGLALTGPTTGFNQVSVDGSSSLEIGNAGSAAAGKVTIDAGSVLSGFGQVSSAIVDQGTIVATGGSLTVGPVTGTGQVQIATGATLNVGGSPTTSTAPVAFIGSTGTLAVEATQTAAPSGISYTLDEQGTVSGFAGGDVINYYDSQAGTTPLTSVIYQPGSGGTGTLQLYSGKIVLGALNLAGNYAGYIFQVTRSGSSGSYDISLATIPSAINALYQSVLGRPADPAELAAYQADLAQPGVSLDTIQADLAGSAEAAADINTLYENALGRSSGAAGEAAWEPVLAQPGQSLVTLQADIAGSAEAAADINTLYENALGRSSGAAGEAAWEPVLAQPGQSLVTLQADIAGSAEAAADINTLYENVLGRSSGAAGEAAWEPVLAQPGQSLVTLQADIAGSAEAAADINTLYENVLGRSSGAAGEAAWEPVLAQPGQSLVTLQADIAGSAEAAADINTLYENVLGRSSGAAGEAAWEPVLAQPGQSLVTLQADIAGSAEAAADINTLYENVLGRSSGAAGEAAWEPVLAQPGQSLVTLRGDIAGSAEAQNDVTALLETDEGHIPSSADISAGQVQLASGLSLAAVNTQTMQLSSNPTFIAGTGGTLQATSGVNVFEFGPGSFGQNTLYGFDPTHDIIQFSRTQFVNLESVLSDESSTGNGVQISLDGSHSILLDGVASSSLVQSDFRFT